MDSSTSRLQLNLVQNQDEAESSAVWVWMALQHRFECECMFEQGAAFFWGGFLRVTVLILPLQRWNALSLTTVCAGAWSVCCNGADARWGWALRRCPVVSLLETCQRAQPASGYILSRRLKERTEGFYLLFLCPQWFPLTLKCSCAYLDSAWRRVVCCCLCVSPDWVSSPLGMHCESQSLTAMQASFYVVLYFPASVMLRRLRCCMNLQERAGAAEILYVPVCRPMPGPDCGMELSV